MRTIFSFQSLLGNLLVISLFTCLCATAFRLEFLPNSLSDRIFGRSLPGSLITAPQGAVGYQPPPGPVVNEAEPTKTHPKVYKTITTTIVTREITHELRQAPYGMSNSSTSHGPARSVAMVTGTVTKTQIMVIETQTAGGSKDAAWSWGVLPVSLLISFWYL